MDVVTCSGTQLKSLMRGDDAVTFIGFKYLTSADLIDDVVFSLIIEKSRLVGLLKYSVVERKDKGWRGIVGLKILYTRIYYLDVRSDKNGDIRSNIELYLVDELVGILNSYNKRKHIINISTTKGLEALSFLEDELNFNLDKVKYIRKGRVHYGG